MTQSITVTGPIFDGRAARAAVDLCDAIEYAVAAQAFAEVRGNMDAAFRNPTPYYEVQVAVEERGDATVVHDRGIVYGPWLETGARSRPSSFRGYSSFRRAAAAVKPQVGRLIQSILPTFLRRMG